MTENEENALEVIAGTVSALPDPVRTTFIAAASRVLGGLASLPAAWLRRPAQGFEDTTDARSIVSRGLATAIVEHTKSDPLMMQAALEVYLPDGVRKARNRVATIAVAAEDISNSSADGDKASMPDEDWVNQFMRYSEDASSERLQALFGKILAGEVVNPGSFSPSTLRTVSEMTQPIAKDFEWAWSRNYEDSMLKTPDFNRGESWERLSRLREAGLVKSEDSAIYAPPFNPVLPNRTSPWMFGDRPHWLMIYTTEQITTRVDVFPFTRMGLELGRLLPPPDWASNLRAVASTIPKSGIASIHLYSGGRPGEAIWTAPSDPTP